MTSAILRYFAENESLGLVYPPYFGLKRNQPDWGSNREICARLYSAHHRRCARGALPGLSGAGSFFWARTRYLQPLFDLELTDTDFPEEMSQSDGALAHAVERMIGLLDKPTGMVKQCVSVTPPLFSRRSGRNGQWLSRIVRTCDRAAPYRAASAPGCGLWP